MQNFGYGMNMQGGPGGQRDGTNAHKDHGTKRSNFVAGKVYLGGLDPSTTSEMIRAYAEEWGGEIGQEVNHQAGRNYAFVIFKNPEDAVHFLNRKEHYLNQKKIDVRAATPKGEDLNTPKIFVGGIPSHVTDDEFTEHFNRFGPQRECGIRRDAQGASKGFGFVTFEDPRDVDKCLVIKHYLGGQEVDVKRAMGDATRRDGGGAPGGMGGDRGPRRDAPMMGGGDRGAPRAGGDRPPRQPRPDDWFCACGATNFGHRTDCHKCKTPKPGSGAGGGGGGGQGGQGGGQGGMNPMNNPMLSMMMGGMPGMGGAGMGGGVPGGMGGGGGAGGAGGMNPAAMNPMMMNPMMQMMMGAMPGGMPGMPGGFNPGMMGFNPMAAMMDPSMYGMMGGMGGDMGGGQGQGGGQGGQGGKAGGRSGGTGGGGSAGRFKPYP